MSNSILWFSAAVMVSCLLLKRNSKIAEILGGTAWFLFGLYWVTLIPGFYEKADYINIILVLLLFSFCLLLALFAARLFKDKMRRKDPVPSGAEALDRKISAFFDLTKLAAVVCIIYMPFKLIISLSHALIESVAFQTVYLLNMLGYDAAQTAYDQIACGSIAVSVILACTAIESVAFFTGLVLTARDAGPKRKIFVFLVTVPVIYILNLIRNAFIVAAYSGLWFGSDSFEIAHHYIGKTGSGVVLLVLVYVTLKLLPKLTDMVSDLRDLVVDEMKRIFGIGTERME